MAKRKHYTNWNDPVQYDYRPLLEKTDPANPKHDELAVQAADVALPTAREHRLVNPAAMTPANKLCDWWEPMEGQCDDLADSTLACNAEVKFNLIGSLSKAKRKPHRGGALHRRDKKPGTFFCTEHGKEVLNLNESRQENLRSVIWLFAGFYALSLPLVIELLRQDGWTGSGVILLAAIFLTMPVGFVVLDQGGAMLVLGCLTVIGKLARLLERVGQSISESLFAKGKNDS
jgi:predicted nucleic acid-binding Zn ribbon protein